MKSTSDLFNEMIPLGRLIQMVNQKKDRLLNDYLSPMDITSTQLDRLVCKGWIERLPNPTDKRGVLVQLTPDGAALCEQCHQVVGQKLHQELTKNLSTDEVATLECLLKKVLS